MLECQDPVGAKERLTKWWHGEAVEGVAWAIHALRKEPRFEPPPAPEGRDWTQRWTDPAIRIPQFLRQFAAVEYLGEAIPYLDTQIGPGSFGLFLGVEPVFAPNTVWYEPTLKDLAEGPGLSFDPDNHWFRVHVEYIQAALAVAEGRFYVSLPDLVEGLDTLAALYNNQKLLVDLMDRPELVHATQARLTDVYFEVYDRLYQMVKDEAGRAAFSAFQTPRRGVREGPVRYRGGAGARAVRGVCGAVSRPAVERLDYAMFHLDGPDCIRHLDILLQVPAAGDPGRRRGSLMGTPSGMACIGGSWRGSD